MIFNFSYGYTDFAIWSHFFFFCRHFEDQKKRNAICQFFPIWFFCCSTSTDHIDIILICMFVCFETSLSKSNIHTNTKFIHSLTTTDCLKLRLSIFTIFDITFYRSYYYFFFLHFSIWKGTVRKMYILKKSIFQMIIRSGVRYLWMHLQTKHSMWYMFPPLWLFLKIYFEKLGQRGISRSSEW